MEDGMQKGMEKGMKEGIEQGILKVARNMKEKGMSESSIQEMTGLSSEEIAKL